MAPIQWDSMKYYQPPAKTAPLSSAYPSSLLSKPDNIWPNYNQANDIDVSHLCWESQPPAVQSYGNGLIQSQVVPCYDLNTSKNHAFDSFPTVEEIMSERNKNSASIGGTQDAVILSDDMADSTESRTDHSNVAVRHTAKADIPLDAAVISNNFAANKGSNGCVADIDLPLFVDRTPSLPQRSSVAQQPSELRPNAGAAEMTTACVDRNFHNELDERVADVIAEGNHKDDGEHNPYERFQSLQPDVLGAPQQSDLGSGPLPAYHGQQGASENICQKHPRRISLPGQSIDSSTASTGLNSINIEESQPCASTTNPSPERQLNQKTAADSNSTDLSNEGHTKGSYPATDSERERSCPRKHARVTASKGGCIVEEDSTYSDVPSQKRTKRLPSNVQGSEEIPIHGYFTLKAVQSELMYCLTFTQGQSPSSHKGGPSQAASADLGESQVAVSVTDHNQWRMRKVIGRKTIDGEVYYRVDWAPTWEPESELGGAENLIDEYSATLILGQVVRGLSEGEPKKPRGRPRKQG